MRTTPNDVDNFIKLSQEDRPIKEIVEITGFSRKTVKNHFNKRGFKNSIKGLKIRNTDEIEILELYEKGLSANKIAKIKNVSTNAINKVLNKNKIARRKRADYSIYSFNKNFFKTIDTEEKAYFLGLLMADGNICKKQAIMKIVLQERDAKILSDFSKYIEFNGPIKTILSKNKNHQNYYSLSICSKILCDHLIEKGCIPNKSLVLKFPTSEQVPEYLIHHFIRGYFDGDGCISGSGNKVSFMIISARDFCEKLNVIFSRLIGPKNLKVFSNGNTTMYRASGNKKLTRLFNFLYHDATIYFDRKINKFKQCIY